MMVNLRFLPAVVSNLSVWQLMPCKRVKIPRLLRSLRELLNEHAGMAHLYGVWWRCVMTGWLWLGG
jgi:hypothetical protein